MANWIRVLCDEVGIDYEGYKRRLTSLPKRRRPSFITIHYIFILGFTIANSIVLYGGGKMPYIDALFFASGSATQSGLNTIDVNLLDLYQQVAIYLATFFCTPIFINTIVVFVRLYWFERRFQNVVQDARSARQSRQRSFTRSMARDPSHAELDRRGVNGRQITVLRDTVQPIESAEGFREKDAMVTVPETDSSTSSGPDRSDWIGRASGAIESPPSRTIKFPDEFDLAGTDRHGEVLARQRNEDASRPLRIPGPREADEGAVPEEVEARMDAKILDEDEFDRHRDHRKPFTETQSHAMRQNVTISEPPRPLHTTHTEDRGHRRVPSNPYAFRSPMTQREEELESTSKRRRPSVSSLRATASHDAREGTVSYLSWQPTVGRNSLFLDVDLTEEQREELGGIEYRALKTLAVVLVTYYVCFHLLGVIIFVPWIIKTEYWGQIVDASGQNRTWWGIFTAATFFNDLGFTLTPDSFISFQQATVVMILGSFLIVIGNTGFPCMLRFIIWLTATITGQNTALYEELRFLLDHPRRCFTLLFPSAANWVLFTILILLNGIDLLFFVILDLNDPVVTSLPPGFKFLDGLFQAVSTRTAGTACVNIADLHPGIQVSYLIMMYISVFPIAISVRRTNVYEERSLGIYSSASEEAEDENEPSYVGAHLRKQLSFDLWFIFAGLFIIAIVEGGRISDPNEPDFTLFAILFEVVSAYGTVGLSLGYSGINASFSAEFAVISKLVIIAMQIRGRHRGLPYELDRAINLPSNEQHLKEQEEAARRLGRSSTLNLIPSATHNGLPRPPTLRAYGTSTGRSIIHDTSEQASGQGHFNRFVERRPQARQGH